MTVELGELMKRAGCFAVFFGVESGDDEVLKKMNKGYTSRVAYDGIQIAKKHGLATHASFIVGYPGETRETFENTLELIIKARPDTVNLGQFRVEHDTIVYGKKEFQLEGIGMTWNHVTMDSQMADALVVEGNQRLLESGLCMGTECGYPTFMGLGQSLEEALQTMQDLDTMGMNDQYGSEEFESAKQRLRHLILHRFPSYIREDQQAWEKALG
jgi:radical SAM superfamily enzyme